MVVVMFPHVCVCLCVFARAFFFFFFFTFIFLEVMCDFRGVSLDITRTVAWDQATTPMCSLVNMVLNVLRNHKEY